MQKRWAGRPKRHGQGEVMFSECHFDCGQLAGLVALKGLGGAF